MTDEPRVPERTTKLSRFGPAFAWLLARGVSSDRIARLFDAKPSAIRVAALRARSTVQHALVARPSLSTAPTAAERRALGLRPHFDEVVWTAKRESALEWLHQQIEVRLGTCRSEYRFLDGAASLQLLLPFVGFPADVRRIHLEALIHQQIAWFLVHSGMCSSAASEAEMARDLWRAAYHESPRRLYAEEFIRSGLIGSQAALLARHPDEALAILALVADAASHMNAPLGSDHFRQRGVAMFQKREDEQARKCFKLSAQTMERLGEASTPVSILMTGPRHINLLGPLNWDSAQEILSAARNAFGPESLEYSMSIHWAVACALSTDSLAVTSSALELLQTRPQPAPHFGHQATIAKLLSITPELGLDERLRKAWVRRALYENTFRNR